MVTVVNGKYMLICEWFAKCMNPTLKATIHPALDNPVPVCERCAAKAQIKPEDLLDCEITS